MEGRLRVPWVTIGLGAALSAVFLLEWALRFDRTQGGEIDQWTLVAMGSEAVWRVRDHGEWDRLFTANLLHADLGAFLSNVIAVLLVGTFLERTIGGARMWVLFFSAGVSSCIVSLVVETPVSSSTGASGSLCGLAAALLFASGSSSGTRERWIARAISLAALLSTLPAAFSEGASSSDLAHWVGATAGAAVWFGLSHLHAPAADRVVRALALAFALVGSVCVLVAALRYRSLGSEPGLRALVFEFLLVKCRESSAESCLALAAHVNAGTVEAAGRLFGDGSVAREMVDSACARGRFPACTREYPRED